MPNWCECDLYIKGRVGLVIGVLNEIKSEEAPLDFEKIIPMPASLRITSPAHTDEEKAQAAENKKLYGFTDWYEWSINRWGTKWNTSNAEVISHRPSGATLKFSTAWAPPLPVIVELGKRFPFCTFTLRYFERGMEFQGVLTVKGEKVLKNEEKKYSGNRGG